MYGERTRTPWSPGAGGRIAGTYSAPLALDPSGNPAISFGDGLHYGNLTYAQKNGTAWDVNKVDGGSAGDVGEGLDRWHLMLAGILTSFDR